MPRYYDVVVLVKLYEVYRVKADSSEEAADMAYANANEDFLTLDSVDIESIEEVEE